MYLPRVDLCTKFYIAPHCKYGGGPTNSRSEVLLRRRNLQKNKNKIIGLINTFDLFAYFVADVRTTNTALTSFINVS